ncbi:cobaltochelatase subunit CobN [Streptomyces sp. NPDC048187]|uniref:cobaltochelatase subunit CobN n=1 Tax=Streptomyces sp. NPDC048187 TaxID=3365509 RepID=UPI00370FA688
MSTMPSLSTADTELPAARASDAGHRIGGPTRIDVREELPGPVVGADLAVARLLGGETVSGRAATADHLFGYGTTAPVMEDRTYRPLGVGHVFAPENRDVVKTPAPGARGGITERLPEAADRGLWAAPDARTPGRPRATYLEPEGDLEGDDK